jgi:hypothetical protein
MMYRKIFLGLFLLMGFQLTHAQDTLSGNYGSLILAKKNYVINEVISVSDSFVVEAGAQVQINSGASIICLGSVRFRGTPTARIRITSSKNQTGNGIVIQGVVK